MNVAGLFLARHMSLRSTLRAPADDEGYWHAEEACGVVQWNQRAIWASSTAPLGSWTRIDWFVGPRA
ncbi:hypothetical protein ACRE_041500 [Hapsidospora chrysogenum ATCC 11550]|uniref:Uncharacterized protein n=1 Tax=Hapsidospora chrysogenum (strain ATCC 11550 / CBS 779.69 / DSM 880 / IAM 14645 / JCM 23072 / IMI 49137) TaxID=857340 RepID=A0A086T6V5_HAPC1|nr:hypothetical protein ACRE_041500 [Hapsidospora chrysogenum ATCC 11550]